ncbi:MAG: single-stranded-DNA-specific exonuclease RecJ [Rubellimicrobium sp.]|nr:single-stranded-DNA-specific exonuclease RecJ [Rubellimicrobium sp.]
MSAFLGVEHSATGRRWTGPTAEDERHAEALAREAGLALPLAHVLARRGVDAPGVPGFLAPRLRDLMPDPRSLRDMEAAAARLVDALRRRERIAIFADYDVDGGASAALILDWLRAQDHDATLYIPDRIDEGYGPNAPAMAALAQDHSLIVCVDCGTLSHGPIAAAKGADVVVFDHHLGGETLPPALAVVNPNRQDEDRALSHLCAAGVVFLALAEAGRQLRGAGMTAPDLMPALDLVALATVADVAPLVGVNRAFVRTGLRVMAGRGRPGLRALADVARLDRAPEAWHLGFLLGPRVNAGGRIGAADLGARLLSTQDAAEAVALAQRLDALNGERRAIEAAVKEEALAQIEARGTGGPLVWAAGENWHPGVVGIVAARLKEATHRPAVVLGLDGDTAKGSARSVAGVDLGAAVHRLQAEGLIVQGGGHPMAAGLTLRRGQIGPAMERLADLLARQGAGQGGAGDLRIDGALMARGASMALVESLAAAGPFGAGAPAPRFALPDLRVAFARTVGSDHLKLALEDDTGARLDAIAFGAAASPLADLLRPGARIHAAGMLETNHWQGRSTVQLRLEDAAGA